jgi:hypothetical protein
MGTGGNFLPGGGHGVSIDRGGLNFVELPVGHGASAGAQFPGVAGDLAVRRAGGQEGRRAGGQEGRRGHGGSGPGASAQGPADTDEGFVALVRIFTGHDGGTPFLLGVEHGGREGGPAGFHLLFQRSEGVQQVQQSAFRSGAGR